MADDTVLEISVTFPQGAYSGSELGAAERFPSPARLHEALLAAAAGGPWGVPDGRVLVACDRHREALEWLEQHEPLGVVPPASELTVPRAVRYRWRASPIVLMDTAFEPRSALAGPIRYLWPAAPAAVEEALREIAGEVTHVGRADSIALVYVRQTTRSTASSGIYRLAARRGPGLVMRVPGAGRTGALVKAHRAACVRGGHATGPIGRQAYDVQVTGANEQHTVLRRFAPPQADIDWPYTEVWALKVDAPSSEALLQPELRVSAAVGIHRALINAIGEDVPPFITGRDGDGPLRGAGHLAIQVARDDRSRKVVALLALPPDVPDADRATLRAALGSSLRAGARRRGKRTIWFSIEDVQERPAMPFWTTAGPLMRTAAPMVLDAPGHPRNAPWTLEDAVLCSLGYAMRGVLERSGVNWGGGWAFRRRLVETLRKEYGAAAVVRRVPDPASRYAHRIAAGDLAVAVHAVVRLGKLAPVNGGFLALGRARHLGGGLLVPIEEGSR